MVMIDRLFWLPHRLVEMLSNPVTKNGKGHDHVLVIKFMGMGSIIQLAALCDEHQVDKSKLTLLTIEQHKELCALIGYNNCIFIRTRNFLTLIIDCWNTIWLISARKPTLVVDFERCSHVVGSYTKLLASVSRCSSISFESNRNLQTHNRIIFSVDNLNQRQLFLKGIEGIPKKGALRKQKNIRVDPTKIIVNVNASNYLLARRYPMDSFVQLIELLSGWNPQLEFILTGGLNESTYVEDLMRKITVPVIRNVAGKWSLRRLVEELSGCVLFITNDSGPLHLASYLNIPTLSIWGPTQPKHFGYDSRTSITSCSLELTCSPCLKHPNSHPARACAGQISCMKDLKPSTIFAKAISLLVAPPATRTIYLPSTCET